MVRLAPVDPGEIGPPLLLCHESSLNTCPTSRTGPSGRSSRRSRHDSHWPVGARHRREGGLPLDLPGHVAKVLSRRRRWTSGIIPPQPRFADDRCHDAPIRTEAAAALSPAWASEMTSCTREGRGSSATARTRSRTRRPHCHRPQTPAPPGAHQRPPPWPPRPPGRPTR